jgi:DNA-binding NarL/FixJ family response regulator
MNQDRPSLPHVPTARLIIVDDHVLVRAGLLALLTIEPDLAVVGEPANGQEALALCRHLQSDLVLMDIRMPVVDGLTATRLIREACPVTKVLRLTIAENPAYLAEAQQAGADGYLLKDATHQELVSAIWQVLAGRLLFG